MMRSNRPRAATTALKSHAPHTECKHQTWRSHGVHEACDARTAAAADGRLDRIIAHGFEAMHNDAVE
eukprot:10746388-Lingulodinium_polyedra.AAC.1